MAHLTIPEEYRRIADPADIAAYLEPLGIQYERWPVQERCNPDASAEQVLAAYAAEIEHLKMQGGYVTADVIDVSPQTPGLEAMLDKFSKEHTHAEDEVRFVLKGSGIFHIAPEFGPILALQLDPGDLINVPAGTKHWFHLCEERTLRAVRLFQNQAGWVPYYVDEGRHKEFTPVCWGEAYVPARHAARERVTVH